MMKAMVVAAALVLTPLSPINGAVTPDREIVPLDAPQLPLWKENWDAGREAARNGDLVNAARFYKELISQKPQIEAAKWEYCKILFGLREYDELPALLESLIESNSRKLEYFEMAGYVFLKQKEYRQAVNYLGQVYSASPEGQRGAKVLAGLVNGLLGLGKDDFALPLMEQLLQRTPADSALIKTIAETAYKTGHMEKAKGYYKLLISSATVTDELLKEASEVFMAADDEEGAAGIWQNIVQRDPQAVDYHRRLYRYFLQSSDPEKGLPHIMKVIENGVENEPELLLIAGRLYFYDAGRADKALRLFERYLSSMPEHHEIKTEIAAVREKIAGDLLSIIENDGAENLWDDLEKITTDRLILFNLMADSLEKAEKTAAAIDVLKIIYEQTSADSEAFRLAKLYSLKGDKVTAYKYYKQVREESNLTFNYYRKKAAFENLLGLDREELQTYKKLLELKSGRISLRKKALKLAGQIGLVSDIEQIAQPVVSKKITKDYLGFYLAYAKTLRLAGLYDRADSFYRQLLEQPWLSESDSSRIMLGKADLYEDMEMIFEQQQVYRKLLMSSSSSHTAAFRLIKSSLVDGSIEDAWTLYEILKRKLKKNGTDVPELIKSHALLLEAQGKVAKAVAVLEQYLGKLRENTRNGKAFKTELPIEIELCRLYMLLGAYEKCDLLLKRYPKKDRVSLNIRFLKNIVHGKGKINVRKITEDTISADNSSGGVTSLFKAAELSEKFNDNDGALAVIEEIIRLEPDSMRARIEKARLLRKNGNLAESSEIYRQLLEILPGDVYVLKTFLELEARRGNYAEIIKRTEKTVRAEYKQHFSLIRARALWGEERREESLQLYDELLHPSVNSRLQQELTRHKLSVNVDDQSKKDAMWGLFYYDLSNRLDNLNALDERDGFLSLLGTKEGQIIADLYSAYRYEKSIANEYLARKAVEEKRYITAEKQYRKSLEEGTSTEGLKDLAKIYERLGDYGKEAEVYSVLEQQGESSTVILESMERNKLTRAPTLSLDYAYLSKDGRGGAIDLEKKKGGVSFQFLPQISSSIELQYEELFYDSVNGGRSLDGRMISTRGWWEMSDNTLMNYGLGYHLLDSGFDSTLVYNFRLDQKLQNHLKGYLEYELDVEDDTVDSLEQAIDVATITAGISVESENGFLIGVEYNRLAYSDDNSRNRIYAWSSYSIYSEFTTVMLEYSYEIMSNSEEGFLQVDPITGVNTYTLPYWSPDNYWQHLVTLRFHHLLKNFETFKKDPSYYSLDFKAGFDSEDNFVLNSSMDIFLEMNDNFLLKGNLCYLTSSDYNDNRAALSLLYRW